MGRLFAKLNSAVATAMDVQPRLRAEYDDELARIAVAAKLGALLDRYGWSDEKPLAASGVPEASCVPAERILAIAFGVDDGRPASAVEEDVRRVAGAIEGLQHPEQGYSRSN